MDHHENKTNQNFKSDLNATRVVIVDNYDSFTYNLVHLIEKIGFARPDVVKNDKTDPHDLLIYDKIILSPGPGLPSEAGNLIPVIKALSGIKPIFGVCLGHQAIAEAFGGILKNTDTVYHGQSTNCRVVNRTSLFDGISDNFIVGRYHSWIVSHDGFPPDLRITAEDDDGIIMAMEHRKFNLVSVQFHPESVLTPEGERILANWLLN